MTEYKVILDTDKLSNFADTFIDINTYKRLEQDSKQLTQWLDEARRNADFWCDKCTSLEQENKRYKQLLQGCPADGDNCGFCEIDKLNKELEQENKALQAYKDVNEDFKKAWDELNGKYKQLLSALEEINILVKNYCNACDEFKAKTYKNKNDCLYCNYGFIKRKINEVLNDNCLRFLGY